MSLLARVAAILVVGTMLSCGGSGAYRQAAAARASAALRCASERVSVREVGGGGYIATGCGRRQSYTCATTLSGFPATRTAVCAPDGPVETIAGAGGAATGLAEAGTATDDARVALAAIAPCPSAEHEAIISITIGTDGGVQRTDTPDVPILIASCVVAALRDARFATRIAVETLRLRLYEGPGPASSSTPSPPAESAAASAARRWLSDFAAAILACTSSDAAAVVAEWTAEGALTIRLPDARAGTPEDGCVRALSAGAGLDPPPGAAGSVLHAVH